MLYHTPKITNIHNRSVFFHEIQINRNNITNQINNSILKLGINIILKIICYHRENRIDCDNLNSNRLEPKNKLISTFKK